MILTKMTTTEATPIARVPEKAASHPEVTVLQAQAPEDLEVDPVLISKLIPFFIPQRHKTLVFLAFQDAQLADKENNMPPKKKQSAAALRKILKDKDAKMKVLEAQLARRTRGK